MTAPLQYENNAVDGAFCNTPMGTKQLTSQLYFIGTPIGNLGDITARAIDILKNVDFVVAEDTRHSRVLLNHYGITTPMMAYHKFNEQRMAEKIIQRVKTGETCGVISDAGLPGVSDPGFRLLSLAIQQNVRYTVIPGPTAVTTAVLLSGCVYERFMFCGFLPPKSAQRRKELLTVRHSADLLVFFESPQRIVSCLEDIEAVYGDCMVVVVREMTKIYEEVIRGTVQEVLSRLKLAPIKGEIVLLVQQQKIDTRPPAGSFEDDMQKLHSVFPHLTRKDMVKIISLACGIDKREVYKSVMEK